MTGLEIKRESATLKQIQIFAESRAFSREVISRDNSRKFRGPNLCQFGSIIHWTS